MVAFDWSIMGYSSMASQFELISRAVGNGLRCSKRADECKVLIAHKCIVVKVSLGTDHIWQVLEKVG